jgi:hypothetical protein
LGPDSDGSADPNPDWQSGSGYRQAQIVLQKEKMKKFIVFNFEELSVGLKAIPGAWAFFAGV